jgi:hypothetical protein
MDVINELKEIEDNNLPVEMLIENLEEEQVKLGKKIYILKVVNLSKAITKLSQSEILKDKILGMNLTYHQMYDNYQFSMHLFDYQEKTVKTDPQFREKSKTVVELFKNNGKLNENYVSESFWQDGKGKILFNKAVDKQIFDLFLNEELKKILDYSQLSVELKDKEGGKKRPKI